MVVPNNMPPQEEELFENEEDKREEDNERSRLHENVIAGNRADTRNYQDNLEGAVGYSRLDRGNVTGSQQELQHRRIYSAGEMQQLRAQQNPNHNQNDLSEWQQRQSTERRVLNHNQCDSNYSCPDNSRVSPEMRTIGEQLFSFFIEEEIRKHNLHEPEGFRRQNVNSLSRRNRNLAINRNLRHIANEFADTPLRERVRARADSVSLQDLNFETFSDLLFGLFQEGGVTSERVIVLFYFCSDLAIRALCTNLIDRFYSITQWSRLYIVSFLSEWVEENGGWDVVFEQSMNHFRKMAIIGFCCVSVVVMAMYIRNNINHK